VGASQSTEQLHTRRPQLGSIPQPLRAPVRVTEQSSSDSNDEDCIHRGDSNSIGSSSLGGSGTFPHLVAIQHLRSQQEAEARAVSKRQAADVPPPPPPPQLIRIGHQSSSANGSKCKKMAVLGSASGNGSVSSQHSQASRDPCSDFHSGDQMAFSSCAVPQTAMMSMPVAVVSTNSMSALHMAKLEAHMDVEGNLEAPPLTPRREKKSKRDKPERSSSFTRRHDTNSFDRPPGLVDGTSDVGSEATTPRLREKKEKKEKKEKHHHHHHHHHHRGSSASRHKDQHQQQDATGKDSHASLTGGESMTSMQSSASESIRFGQSGASGSTTGAFDAYPSVFPLRGTADMDMIRPR